MQLRHDGKLARKLKDPSLNIQELLMFAEEDHEKIKEKYGIESPQWTLSHEKCFFLWGLDQKRRARANAWKWGIGITLVLLLTGRLIIT